MQHGHGTIIDAGVIKHVENAEYRLIGSPTGN